MFKQFVAAVCCGAVLICAGCGAQAPAPSGGETEQDVVLETAKTDGETYYLLTSEADLQTIGSTYPLLGNYMLANDITLSEEWSPIGNTEEPFTGIFDGNGYQIRQLTVTKAADAKGFFGASRDAVIRDLVLVDAQIDVFGFFPIVARAENTEIIGCSVNELQ